MRECVMVTPLIVKMFNTLPITTDELENKLKTQELAFKTTVEKLEKELSEMKLRCEEFEQQLRNKEDIEKKAIEGIVFIISSSN
jgi:predicted RNase H-like nuclease (RuvC/YqgF family)